MSTLSPQQIARAIARAERGQSLTVDEFTALHAARGEQLDRLMKVAASLRDLGRGDVVTYSPKVFIPLTRLCRDRCHYCTFATTPNHLASPYLSRDEVLAIARQGASVGCTEALFTLGDRPEERWSTAREWLAEAGYDSTISYVRAMAIAVLEETGLLPHLNPGVMTWEELRRLKSVAPSMGLMLESTSQRLFRTPGEVHYASPDKEPTARLRCIEDAGRASIPFTTGVLIGIGETYEDRAEALVALRALHRQYGHLQEIIVQNFRAKPDTAMRNVEDADHHEYLAAIAAARIAFGPRMRIQAPPNLTDEAQLRELLAAGVDDWGGVSPVTIDHVNPERPWPELETLTELTQRAGFRLAPRLTVHPEFVQAGTPWIDPQLAGHVAALADAETGLGNAVAPVGRRWQLDDDEGQYAAFATRHQPGRIDLATQIDVTGRLTETRSDFDEVYGDWAQLRDDAQRTSRIARMDGDAKAALNLASTDPAALAREEHHDLALALISADLDVVSVAARLADELRRDVVGDDVTYIVNRNLNFTNICYTGCRFCAFAQREGDLDAFTLAPEDIAARVQEAVAKGATEICMQGGIHPDLPGTAYFDLVRTVKQAAPEIHLHAFSPMEIMNGASRSGMSVREWLTEAKSAGLDSIPGTAAEILDDDVRWILTKGKLPTSAWIDVITTAHEVGLPSSSTMMYGHVDAPVHWVNHLRVLRTIGEHTGGFTEFVALPFVHHNAPVYLAGVSRPGPTLRENLAVHAMARLMLHGVIANIQTSWVKLGIAGSQAMLRAGANDLGGTLMEETISRMAGAQNGSELSVAQLEAIATGIGRPARQRRTTYAAF